MVNILLPLGLVLQFVAHFRLNRLDFVYTLYLCVPYI